MKHLKTWIVFLLTLAMALSLAACTNGNAENGGNDNSTQGGGDAPDGNARVLVAYFSCTNTTKRVAETIQRRLDSDIYQIMPAVPYTSEDLNYNDSDSRASVERDSSTARPEINGSVDNISQYDVIFLGYPIWWGQAPKIIYTFLESYNLDGITIIPFCTSGSSGIGTSASNLHRLAPTANWKNGARVSGTNINQLIDMMS